MHSSQTRQHGASAITLILILTIIGAGVYIGFQYIPQYIEAGTVDSILENIEITHKATPMNSVRAIQDIIDKQLNMNALDDLRDSFKVRQDGEVYIVKVSFTRELNLIYEQRPVKYEKSITLR